MKALSRRVARLERCRDNVPGPESPPQRDPVVAAILYDLAQSMGPEAVEQYEKQYGKPSEADLEELRRLQAEWERNPPPKVDPAMESRDPETYRILREIEESLERDRAIREAKVSSP